MKLFTAVFITLIFITTPLLFADTTDYLNIYKKKCDKGDIKSCNNLGALYYSGLGIVDIDYIKAFELYSFACDKGNFTGCVNLASMYVEGKGVKQNYNKAIRIYTDACENSLGNEGCIELGRIYLNSQIVDIDYEKALNLFKKGCDNGNSDCIDYSELYDKLCLANPKPFCPNTKYK